MSLQKTTPILLAGDVPACVKFWAEFGLECVLAVPEDDASMFAIVSNGSAEIMYQSKASITADDAAVVDGVDKSIVYVEVESLADILSTVTRHPIVKPEHKAPYGATEIYIRDPAGNVIGLAEFPNTQESS
ncbi:MAG: hypothetical protein AAGA44_06250 [Pseudomonadota bacterium]